MPGFLKALLSEIISLLATGIVKVAMGDAALDPVWGHGIWVLLLVSMFTRILCWLLIPSQTRAHKFLFWGPVVAFILYAITASHVYQTTLRMGLFPEEARVIVLRPALTWWVILSTVALGMAVKERQRLRDE